MGGIKDSWLPGRAAAWKPFGYLPAISGADPSGWQATWAMDEEALADFDRAVELNSGHPGPSQRDQPPST
jgi:hypothetical protein